MDARRLPNTACAYVELDDLAIAVALGLGEQVVIPFTVRMCPQVRCFSGFSDNAYVASSSGGFVDCEKLVSLVIDLLNR
jgi:hypothetical protein